MKQGAMFILVNDIGEILLQKRTSTYRYPKQWTMFGGGIEDGEFPEEAVIRELKEELGLDIEMTFMETKIVGDEDNEEELFLFKGKLNDISKINLTEGNGFAFFGFDEIKDLNCIEKDIILGLKEDLK